MQSASYSISVTSYYTTIRGDVIHYPCDNVIGARTKDIGFSKYCGINCARIQIGVISYSIVLACYKVCCSECVAGPQPVLTAYVVHQTKHGVRKTTVCATFPSRKTEITCGYIMTPEDSITIPNGYVRRTTYKSIGSKSVVSPPPEVRQFVPYKFF